MTRLYAKHKFGAKPVELDGIRFDSKIEGKYYQKLKIRQSAGDVVFFLRQVPLHLPGNIRYVVDFVEFLADETVRFVDVKGCDTPMSKLKRKQAEAVYPISIEIVTKV